MPIQTILSNHLSDILEIISDKKNPFFWNTNKNKPETIWYRGQDNSDYQLIPSLYRKILVGILPKEDIKIKENFLLEEFSTRNYHKFPYKLAENKLLWLSIMQHYGTPTRLLDWSENLLISMYFSLEKYFINNQGGDGVTPCVWLLNPRRLNDEFVKLNFPVKDITPDEINSKIEQNYIPSTLHVDMSKSSIINNLKSPLAVISPYTSDRIYQQSGTFTYFPSEIKDIKTSGLDQYTNSGDYLLKIILAKPIAISNELRLIGIRRNMIYPEIENSSTDILNTVFN